MQHEIVIYVVTFICLFKAVINCMIKDLPIDLRALQEYNKNLV